MHSLNERTMLKSMTVAIFAWCVLHACAAPPPKAVDTVPVVSKDPPMQSPRDSSTSIRSPSPAVQEMVGATNAPFTLGPGTSQASFQLHQPTGPSLLRADGTPRRVFLRIEHITSKLPAPSFEVYLNVPAGDEPKKHPELLIGTMSTFGLNEASRSNEDHPGNGLTFVQEVTGVFLRLALMRDWDARTLRVSFVPILWDYALDVQVGRMSLMIE